MRLAIRQAMPKGSAGPEYMLRGSPLQTAVVALGNLIGHFFERYSGRVFWAGECDEGPNCPIMTQYLAKCTAAVELCSRPHLCASSNKCHPKKFLVTLIGYTLVGVSHWVRPTTVPGVCASPE